MTLIQRHGKKKSLAFESKPSSRVTLNINTAEMTDTENGRLELVMWRPDVESG